MTSDFAVMLAFAVLRAVGVGAVETMRWCDRRETIRYARWVSAN